MQKKLRKKNATPQIPCTRESKIVEKKTYERRGMKQENQEIIRMKQ
jgi:hypothetical protein